MQSLFAEPIELHSDTGTTFVDIDGEAYDELQWQCFGGDRLWQITIACDSDILLPILRRDSGAADTRVSGKYFYHTDHLGSANWVTKGDEAVQFIHYMPYGEMWYNQRGSAYNERYKYTGKERDEETGNDYFGARYYAAYTPMWLSPDPLMDKYPGISPYAYCNWNPMKYVDPDGGKVFFADGVSSSFKNDFRTAVKYMNSTKISNLLHQLQQSPISYYIAEGNNFDMPISEFNPKNKTITWYPRIGIITDNSYEMSPVEVLNHEVDHAVRYDKDAPQQYIDYKTEDSDYGNKEEKRVITGSEQQTAQKLGKLKKGEVTRNNHNGSPYETESPISTESKWIITPNDY